MARLVVGAAAVVLLFHGLIHLMGTTVYMKLGKVEGLSYKTTLLGGRWDLGEGGIRVFGALWTLPALGFAVAATALWTGWPSWRPLLLGATVFSLALTALDWGQAYAGVAVNLVILFAVVLGPRLAAWFGR